MILIKKIEFDNFRQYKKITIDFDAKSDNNLFVLRAKNGTGKTTFLNGILWCLYEKEHYINDEDKALPIINSSLVQSSDDNESLFAKVILTINDGNSDLKFERCQSFVVVTDPLRGTKNAVPGISNLKITVTPKNNFKNTKVYEDNIEVQSIVKQYFDESIFDYYFFDGENLKNYFAKGKSKRIKESIHNISQVTLLTNAINRVNALSVEKSRSVIKMKDFDENIYDRIDQLKSGIAKLEKENDEIDEKLPWYKEKFKSADDILTGYAPIRANTTQRDKLDKEINELQRDYNLFKSKKQAFIRDSIVYLHFFPRVANTLKMIKEKEGSGSLPPNIDKDQLQQILDNHADRCPVCDSKIDGDIIKHLNELLEQLDVSSATSNFLMEIKGSLEQVVKKCKQYPDELHDLLEEEKYYIREIADKDKELKEISSFLANYMKGGEVDVSKAETDRTNFNTLIKQEGERKALNLKDISSKKQALSSLEAEREQIEAKNEAKTKLNKEVRVYRTLTSKFTDVQNHIMNEIKSEIQRLTWQRFDAMIWKKNTFGKVEIDDNYQMAVYNRDGNEMTGGLGATEYMALAYSFTLAIHEASGKNCPLVVDSPLGRVSDDNRVNMANELLKVSRFKQIILLFTPDEYSDEVKKIYDNNAASIRDIVLSSDEKEVQKVGE